jgi:hypothetical protein
MIKHFISIALACYVMFGFIYVTEGLARDATEWLKVFVLYSSTILLSVWITWIVMTIKRRQQLSKLGYTSTWWKNNG